MPDNERVGEVGVWISIEHAHRMLMSVADIDDVCREEPLVMQDSFHGSAGWQ